MVNLFGVVRRGWAQGRKARRGVMRIQRSNRTELQDHVVVRSQVVIRNAYCFS